MPPKKSLNTQIVSAESYNVENMIFEPPVPFEIKTPKGPLTTFRINVRTRNEDNTIGKLVFFAPDVFSFGIQEDKKVDEATGVTSVTGYSLPLALWEREVDKTLDEQKAFSGIFDDITEECKNYLVENRKDIKRYELERNDLKKLNPLYWKKVEGKVVEGRGPSLYPKLWTKREDSVHTIKTKFYDIDTEKEINPLDLIGCWCRVQPAVSVDSIFVGAGISIQLKVEESYVKILPKRGGDGTRRLPPPRPVRVDDTIHTAQSNPMNELDFDDDDNKSLNGSLEEEEEEERKVQPPKPKVVPKKPALDPKRKLTIRKVTKAPVPK